MSKKNGAVAKTDKKTEALAEAAATEAVAAAQADLAGIVLSDDERQKLSGLEFDAVRAKVALADLDIQLARAEAQRNELRANVAKSQQAYMDAVVAAAGEHGIDLNDKTARWNFDTSKMTFTRVQ